MRVEDQKGLEEDTVAFAHALQSMYGCIVVLKLEPAGKQSRYAWRVYAVAYLEGDEIPTNGALQRGVSYPSMHHKTFGGGCLSRTVRSGGSVTRLLHPKGDAVRGSVRGFSP